MIFMNVLVVGLGSMGKRRIRILQKYFSDIKIFGVDSSQERREFCQNAYGIEVGSSLDQMILAQCIDCALICTSPLGHADIIKKCLENGIHVFTEINLTLDGYDDNIALANKNGKVLFLSSTPLYRKEIEYIISKTKAAQLPFNYSYHVGQYLPDWHPWEKFKDFFIGDRRTNGCREIFAIEFPWMIQAFGEIDKVQVMAQKVTNLDISFNDSYFVLIKHKNQNQGCFAVDVVCREPVRRLEIYGEELFIEWLGTENSLKSKNFVTNKVESIGLYDDVDKLDEYSKSIIENPYIEELKAFFAEVHGICMARHCFEKDIDVLKTIDFIEESCKR